MRNTWCVLLVVQVLAMRAATMPQGPRVPDNPQGQQIIFGTHSVAERPPHFMRRPFFRPNVPKRGPAFDHNLNGQALRFPPNFDAGTENQINFPDAPAAPPKPSIPNPADGTSPVGTRILINAPCRGHCMTRKSGKCELDAACLFG